MKENNDDSKIPKKRDFLTNEKARLSEFVFDPAREIAFHPYRITNEYLDGSESYISEVISSIKNLSSQSNEYNQYIKDWPSRYHLSKNRTTLLEGVQEVLDKDARVLEIGARCGAITRWLGERYAHVDAIEDSEIRAVITRKRTRDLNNVLVYCGNFLNTSFDRQYDLIILIGVLEYIPICAAKYGDGIEAMEVFLKELSASLTEKGILLVAIENKLGAKYFSGCSEDHTGNRFEGLIGYPDKTPITFSRNEILSIISEAGYPNYKVYHLFPDYKLTETIIPEKDEVLSLHPYHWIATPFEDYFCDRLHLFPDALFLKTVTDAGLIWHFSNSFLILASRTESVNLNVDWLIRKYHMNDIRAPIFHHYITLSSIHTPTGIQYVVNRTPIEGGSFYHSNEQFSFELTCSEYILGRSLTFDILKALFKQSPEKELIRVIMLLHDELLYQFSTGECDEEGYMLVKGEAIDFSFWNVLVGGGNHLIFIDRKWKSKKPIPVDFVIFRNLFFLFESIKPYIENKDRLLFCSILMRHLFKNYSYERMMTIIHREEEFQQWNTGKCIDFIVDLRLNQDFFRKVEIGKLLHDKRRGIKKR